MQPISKAQMFRPGNVVKAFKLTSPTSGRMEIGRITSYMRNDAGIPYGLIIAFEDGTHERYNFAYINLNNTQKSLVTHFVPWGRK